MLKELQIYTKDKKELVVMLNNLGGVSNIEMGLLVDEVM
jgi:dihydroxyacetone kinase